MSNTDIQRELLLETRTLIQVLQFELNRERCQENQRAIKTQINRHPLLAPNQISYSRRNQPQEIFDNWNTVNFVKPNTFHIEKPSNYSPNLSDEIWIHTTSDQFEIDWLADTGSPRSFVNKEEAEKIQQNCKNSKIEKPQQMTPEV